jgi:hypothetical protein
MFSTCRIKGSGNSPITSEGLRMSQRRIEDDTPDTIAYRQGDVGCCSMASKRSVSGSRELNLGKRYVEGGRTLGEGKRYPTARL